MGEVSRRRERRWQRLQWSAVGAATVLVVLRLLLEGGPAPALHVLGIGGMVLSFACIILTFAGVSYDRDEAHAASDAWKALSKADRRELRRSMSRQHPVRPDLLAAAEVISRMRATQLRSAGCLGAGLAVMQLYRELPWAIVLAGPALVLAIAFAWGRGRWLDQYFAVVDQLPASNR